MDRQLLPSEPSCVRPRAAPDAYRAAMRRFAGAVCIVATGTPGRRAGMTATAVCSVSAEPPRLLVCASTDGSSHEPISRNGRLSINLLREDSDALARRFGGMPGGASGDARFAHGRWSMHAGVPLLDDACAAFVCKVERVIPAGTHSIFLCDVVDVLCPDADTAGERACLLYVDGGFRGLAPAGRQPSATF